MRKSYFSKYYIAEYQLDMNFVADILATLPLGHILWFILFRTVKPLIETLHLITLPNVLRKGFYPPLRFLFVLVFGVAQIWPRVGNSGYFRGDISLTPTCLEIWPRSGNFGYFRGDISLTPNSDILPVLFHWAFRLPCEPGAKYFQLFPSMTATLPPDRERCFLLDC